MPNSSQNSSSSFFAIELALHGPPKLTSQLMNAIRSHTGPSPSPIFLHNGLSVRFGPAQSQFGNHHHSSSSHSSLCSSSSSSCPSPSGPSLSARIPSQIFLFSTLEEAQQHFLSANAPNPHQLISRPSVGGICPLVILIAKIDGHNCQILQQIGNQLADHLGGMFKMLPLIMDGGPNCDFPFPDEHVANGNNTSSLSRSSQIHLDMLLHEICALQLDSGHSDLRVRVSSMCGDSPSIESMLSPLLDHTHLPIDHSGRKFYFDAHLPIWNEIFDENGDNPSRKNSPSRKEMPSPTPSQSLFANHRLPRQNGCKARVCISIGSFHQWLLAKWPLQSVQGHLLIFSPSRRASWRHARCAAKLLLDSVGHVGTNGEVGEAEDQERKAMGRSIFLVALAESNAPNPNDKRSSRILAKAERFANRIGAMFASFRSNGRIGTDQDGQHTRQYFLEFFQRILQNPFPPAEYYTITSRRIISIGNLDGEDCHSIAQSQFGICSTLTGSAETLMTERSEGEGEGDDWAAMDEKEQQRTKNVEWRRKSKQSRIALVGSPPPPHPHPQSNPHLSARKRIPPVLRNDSQLSRTTGMTQWTNGSGLTASTLTAKGETSRHGSDSTTRTPLASSGNGIEWNGRMGGERPHSAVILPSSTTSPSFLDDDGGGGGGGGGRQQIEGNQRTPRRLEKLISSFVQFRSTTPIIPLADDPTNGPMPAAGSRRSRIQRMASEQQMAKTTKTDPSSHSPKPQLPSSGHRFAWLRSPRSQSRSRGQNDKCSPFSTTNSSQSAALSPSSTLSSDSNVKSVGFENKSGKQQKSLVECCAQSRDGLPPFLVKCVRTIEENGGLETEGLYRVPGNQMDVERMFQKGGAINFNKIPVHAVATGLKRFLDGLAEPLIPEKMHSAILNVFEGENRVGEAIDGKKTTQIMAAIRSNLPLENWRVLCFLTGHLQRVAEYATENSMDLRNLAKVWSPTLFRPNFESFEAMATSMAKFEMATFLLLFANCGKK